MVTGRKLLLADDSATIQKVVDLTFTDEGLEVITVSDGQQAIEKLEEVTPDIVLADVFMPGLNGYEVCEYIKRNERFRHIPVMLLVGSFEPFDEAEARRVGADDHLTKPFQSIRTLIGKVGTLLSGGSSASTDEATTRKLAPPPEAEKENRPDAEFIERSTANTARLPQPDREEMVHGSNSSKGSFADLSMDDQMIEATPADDYSGHSTRDAQPQQPPQPEQQYARPTAQYSAADLKEAGLNPAFEKSGAPEREVAASSSYAPAQISEQPPAVTTVGQSTVSSQAGSLATSDDALLDLGELETPQALTEADDFFLDLLDDAPTQASSPSSSTASEARGRIANASSTSEELKAAPRLNYEEETAEIAQPVPEFVATEALGEEPSIQASPVEEEAASPVAEYQPIESSFPSERREFSSDMQLAPTERLPDAFRVEESAAEMDNTQSGATASPSPVAGQITLEQLSPEVIDAIARRAVEQLSARVVEQVAWEVVPELAELLIKRRLEENSNQ